MNLAALSFRDLEYIVAVADHLHFGKAAVSCAVSQPTLSAQVRKFEEYVGVEIFERAPRSVLMTERGHEIVAQARIILKEGGRLYDIVKAGAEPLSGTFRLGLIATLGPYLTPLLLQPLRVHFPRMNLVLSEGLTQHLIQALERGDIDALLATSPLRGPDMMELPLFTENLVLAVPRDHALAKVPRIGLGDIDPGELILLNEGHCLRDQVLALFPDRSNQGMPLQAASMESLRQMVAAGLGCALLPQLAVQVGALLDDMVAYRMIRTDTPSRSISMFYRAGFGRIRDARALRDLVRDTLHAVGTIHVQGKVRDRPDLAEAGDGR